MFDENDDDPPLIVDVASRASSPRGGARDRRRRAAVVGACRSGFVGLARVAIVTAQILATALVATSTSESFFGDDATAIAAWILFFLTSAQVYFANVVWGAAIVPMTIATSTTTTTTERTSSSTRPSREAALLRKNRYGDLAAVTAAWTTFVTFRFAGAGKYSTDAVDAMWAPATILAASNAVLFADAARGRLLPSSFEEVWDAGCETLRYPCWACVVLPAAIIVVCFTWSVFALGLGLADVWFVVACFRLGGVGPALRATFDIPGLEKAHFEELREKQAEDDAKLRRQEAAFAGTATAQNDENNGEPSSSESSSVYVCFGTLALLNIFSIYTLFGQSNTLSAIERTVFQKTE